MWTAVIWVQGKQAETETRRSQRLWAGKGRKEADVGSEACKRLLAVLVNKNVQTA